MTRASSRFGLAMLMAISMTLVAPPIAANGTEITCVRYPGTAGGTVRVGPVTVPVPPTQQYLVGVCWDGEGGDLPVLTAPEFNTYPGCGTPCFSLSGNLFAPGYQLSITTYVEGQPETWGPFGYGDENVPVCITFGNPEPSC